MPAQTSTHMSAHTSTGGTYRTSGIRGASSTSTSSSAASARLSGPARSAQSTAVQDTTGGMPTLYAYVVVRSPYTDHARPIFSILAIYVAYSPYIERAHLIWIMLALYLACSPYMGHAHLRFSIIAFYVAYSPYMERSHRICSMRTLYVTVVWTCAFRSKYHKCRYDRVKALARAMMALFGVCLLALPVYFIARWLVQEGMYSDAGRPCPSACKSKTPVQAHI